MLEEIKNIKTSNKEVKNFGFTIGIILFLLSGLLMYYEKDWYQLTAIIAASFIVIGLTMPILLKPIYLFWMTFAIILGWFMTRIILSILFYFIISPIGFFRRIIILNPFTSKIDNDTYWNYRISKNEQNQDYQKQY